MAGVKFAGEEAVERIAHYVNKKLNIASTMPSTPNDEIIILYVGESNDSYIQGCIYEYDEINETWKIINSVQTVELTTAEYEALPVSVQNNGTIYFLTDGEGGGGGGTLAGLTDVNISGVTNGQVIKYNSTTRKWENDDESGGSANYYGTCTGQAANQIKTVTVPEDQGFELKIGALIFVKFDANNSYNATTSNPVKLNVNNTGAKQIYAANTATPTGTAATYLGRANYINQYVYDGTYWVWNGSSADNDSTNNYQLRYSSAVKAATAVTASTVCVGTSAGYKTAASGITFDISYPILYATETVNSGSISSQFYRLINNCTAESLKSGFSGVAYSTCYLVLSSISGNIATIDSTVYTVTPNIEGKMYIPIGVFNSTTYLNIDLTMSSIYIYQGGELKLYGAGDGSFKTLQATLTAGQTTLTFTDSSIVATSLVKLFSANDIQYETFTSSTNSVTFTFEAQSSNVSFTLLIMNL